MQILTFDKRKVSSFSLYRFLRKDQQWEEVLEEAIQPYEYTFEPTFLKRKIVAQCLPILLHVDDEKEKVADFHDFESERMVHLSALLPAN